MRAFHIDPARMRVTTTEGPTGFHERLHDLIATARHRLSLASLYLGTGAREAALVDALHDALARQPALRLQLVVDHSRGLRATANGDSASFTRSLQEAYPERVTIALHRMPQLDGWRGATPSPLNETIAVCHFKAIVADDVALLTGANLSDEYFHCRQCRAIEVHDETIAQLLHELVDVTIRHSHRVLNGRPQPPERPAHQLASAALATVRQARAHDTITHTTLQPVFQHPALGVHQERELLRALFAQTDGHLEIHTPYVNPPADYTRALQTRLRHADADAITELVCPSGDSHSFTTGRGPKALVPGAYIHLEAQLLEQLREAGDLTLRHYHRPGWVFHSKGVWHTTDRLTRTVIGSSSFGGRSVGRDFDLSFLITTTDDHQRDALASERALIAQYAPTTRPVPRIFQRLMPLITPLARSFL